MRRILLLALPLSLLSTGFARAQVGRTAPVVSTTSVTQTTPVIQSPRNLAYAQYLVDTWYHQFLNRAPDAGAAGWVLAMVRGKAPGLVLSQILASREFYTLAGGTRPGFIALLYQDQLGRAPTPGELLVWLNLSRRSSRSAIAFAFLSSNGNVETIAAQQLGRRRHRHR